MDQLKETTEFFDAAFGTVAQGVKSFSDGADLLDIPDFFDEALLWQKGVKGFADAFGKEALNADINLVHDMFSRYEAQLRAAGLNPVLAAAAATHTKGFYFTFVAVKQGQAKDEATEV